MNDINNNNHNKKKREGEATILSPWRAAPWLRSARRHIDIAEVRALAVFAVFNAAQVSESPFLAVNDWKGVCCLLSLACSVLCLASRTEQGGTGYFVVMGLASAVLCTRDQGLCVAHFLLIPLPVPITRCSQEPQVTPGLRITLNYPCIERSLELSLNHLITFRFVTLTPSPIFQSSKPLLS